MVDLSRNMRLFRKLADDPKATTARFLTRWSSVLSDLARVSHKIAGSSIARRERATTARVVARIRRSQNWRNLPALKRDLLDHRRDVRVTLAGEFVRRAKTAEQGR